MRIKAALIAVMMGTGLVLPARAAPPPDAYYETASLLSSLPQVRLVLRDWLTAEEIASFEAFAQRHQAALAQNQGAQFGKDFLGALEKSLASHRGVQHHVARLRSSLLAIAGSKPGVEAIKRYNRGDPAGAVRMLAARLAEGKQSYTASDLGHLAMAAWDEGHLFDAELAPILRAAIEHDPDDMLPRLTLMELARRAGDEAALRDAFSAAQAAAKDRAGRAAAQYALADIFKRQKDYNALLSLTIDVLPKIAADLKADPDQPRLGLIYTKMLGLQLEALAAFSQLQEGVVAARTRLHHVNALIKADLKTVPLRLDRTDTYLTIGTLMYGQERFDYARRYFRWARDYYHQAIATYPRNRPARLHFAEASLKLGDLLEHLDQDERAETVLREGLIRLREYMQAEPGSVTARRTDAEICLQLSQIAVKQNDYDTALRYAGESQAARRALTVLEPDEWWHRALLTADLIHEAELYRDLGNTDQALATLDRAATENEALATSHPDLSITPVTRARLQSMRDQLTGTESDTPDAPAGASEADASEVDEAQAEEMDAAAPVPPDTEDDLEIDPETDPETDPGAEPAAPAPTLVE